MYYDVNYSYILIALIKRLRQLSIIINVVPDCPMEFKCANKECIPWSYRCDSYHDCGCEDQGCDEIDCGGLNLSELLDIVIVCCIVVLL